MFSSEYPQEWEQCRRNAPGVPRHRTVHTFHRAKPFKYAFNFIQWCLFLLAVVVEGDESSRLKMPN